MKSWHDAVAPHLWRCATLKKVRKTHPNTLFRTTKSWEQTHSISGTSGASLQSCDTSRVNHYYKASLQSCDRSRVNHLMPAFYSGGRSFRSKAHMKLHRDTIVCLCADLRTEVIASNFCFRRHVAIVRNYFFVSCQPRIHPESCQSALLVFTEFLWTKWDAAKKESVSISL